MKNKYLTLAEKKLTNNFTGGKNMSREVNLVNAFQHKFSLKITTTADTPKVIALLPSYFKTLGINSGTTPTLHYHN
ncbi:MAG: hypothetical protein LBI45_00580, partial [Bacteroidales bacterium]|nr:hypothetical protein [Bacteroidales bacterium]